MPIDSQSSVAAPPALVTRPYRSGDEAAVNRAFNEVFGQQRSLEEWRWKFDPESGGSHIMLIEETASGEVLAQFTTLFRRFQIGGRPGTGGQSVDDFCRRRSDLALGRHYTRLMDQFRKAYGESGVLDICYGFPGRRHLDLLVHTRRIDEPVPVCCLRREVPTGLRRGWFSRWKVDPLESPEELTEFYTRCAPRYPNGAVRDGEWLRRRYLIHPTIRYLSVGVRRGGSLHAWAVFRLMGAELVMGDLLWDGRSEEAFAALDRWACGAARSEGAGALFTWLNGDDAATAALLRAGWRSTPNPLDLAASIIRYNQTLPADLLQRMYLTMGDGDLF